MYGSFAPHSIWRHMQTLQYCFCVCLLQRSDVIKALHIPYKERHWASWLLYDLNHFVLSFPPCALLSQSITLWKSLVSMSIQAPSRENISLWDLKRSVAFLALSSCSSFLQYSYFPFTERTNSQRSTAGQPNSCHLKWEKEKEWKMAEGLEDLNRIKG